MKKLLLLFTLILSLCACSRVSPGTSSTEASDPSSIEVAEPSDPLSEDEEPSSPTIYEVSDLVAYFNIKGESVGISVSYIEEEDYWYLHYIGEESIDESKNNLSTGIIYFLDFLPLYRETEDGYLFRYMSKYITDPEVYFIYVVVSSNYFAACSIYSYIENNHLTVDVIIYDGRNVIYC